jgi:hypothetical protein
MEITDREIARRTRRSFITGGIAALAGFGSGSEPVTPKTAFSDLSAAPNKRTISSPASCSVKRVSQGRSTPPRSVKRK